MAEIGSGKDQLRSWLNRRMKIVLTDKRVLDGIFLCTDQNANIILGSCTESLEEKEEEATPLEPRILGLAMIPGKHIATIYVDEAQEDEAEKDST